jgi:hypothetical protein
MQASKLKYSFENVVSYDNGETVEVVTVGYDYYPEEINYPHEPDYAEMFDVFVFDVNGLHITYDIPNEEYKRLVDEAKQDFYSTSEAV